MGQLTPEQAEEIDRKTVLIAIAYGCKLPEYLASLSVEDRFSLVKSIDKFSSMPLGVMIKTLLVSNPSIVSGIIEANSEIKENLNLAAQHAKEEIDQWDMEEVLKDIERYRYQINPARNAQYN